MRHNDATGCVTFTQPGYYVLSCPSVFNAHRSSVCSSPHTSGFVAERNCRKKSEEQEHTTNTSSTIYDAQYVPTVSLMSCLPFCDWLVGEWIPACAVMTEAGGNDRVVSLREQVRDGDGTESRIPGHIAAE